MRGRPLLVPLGLFLIVFAVAGLAGPGRIDVGDGQTRYEVARSLVDHRDLVVRDPAVWFHVFPGREGRRYSDYRLPQSLLGVPAVLLADATGHTSEPRRHFFYVLVSAAAAALLAVTYLAWFRRRGLSERRAIFWAAAGIFCTPSWFYATSTFDDILGSAAIVAAVVLASRARVSRGLSPLIWSGVMLGIAFNCKQPLAVFAPAAFVAADDQSAPAVMRATRAGVLAVGLFAGVGFELAYSAYTFPAGVAMPHYVAVWSGQPLTALLVLAVSPAAGVLWYSPTLPLCVSGMREWGRENTRLVAAILTGVAVFVGFIASLSFYKGDLAWGPRYLTPVFALLWLFAAGGSRRWRRATVAAVLTLGVAVQLAALSVVPSRLYLERRLPLVFGVMPAPLYFDPANAHLVQRPREVLEIWKARGQTAPAFSPMADPTEAGFFTGEPGPALITQYEVLDSFRPWWASQIYLPPEQRPVSIAAALLVFASMVAIGVALVSIGARGRAAETAPSPTLAVR